MNEDGAFRLPSGATVVFRDPMTVSRDERRPARRLIAAAQGTDDPDKQDAVADALAYLLIRGWSYDLPVPSVDISSLGTIPAADYDALAIELIKPSRRPFLDTEMSDDPKAPSGSSANSNSESPTGTSISETISLVS